MISAFISKSVAATRLSMIATEVAAAECGAIIEVVLSVKHDVPIGI
jgi:hypothetical protein